MSNPWDSFPIPIRGDDHVHVTYEWVGRAISQWEHVEYQLSRLYSVLEGHPDEERALREYGSAGRIFRDRLGGLRASAEKWFVRSPNQELEKELELLCVEVEGFSNRRNEVAHSVVFPTDFLPFFTDGKIAPGVRRWAVIPPFFTQRKHDSTTSYPVYAYTSRELRELQKRLQSLARRIDSFRKRFM